MSKYTLSPKARRDMGIIWGYTVHAWSREQANKYATALSSTFQALADYPSLGKKCEFAKDLLTCKAGKHIIFYKTINSEEIEIIRILHAQMDLHGAIEN